MIDAGVNGSPRPGADKISRHDRLVACLEELGHKVVGVFIDGGSESERCSMADAFEQRLRLARIHGWNSITMITGDPVQFETDDCGIRRAVRPGMVSLLLAPGLNPHFPAAECREDC